MALLIIEQSDKHEAGLLQGRVLIGRWPDNTVVIDDKAVSRIHAWIGVQDGRYYIADAGSRTGTFVNGDRLQERHVLYDGDQIRIGPATLKYRTDPILPADACEIDLSPRTPDELSGKHGVFMDCVCGAPLWLPSDFNGVGQCRYCGHTVTQGVQPEVATPIERPTMQSLVPPNGSNRLVKHAGSDDDDFDNVMNDAFTKTKPVAPAGRRVPPPAPFPRPTSREPGPVIPSISPAAKAPVPIAPTITQAVPLPSTSKLATTVKVEKDQVCGICHAPITVFDEVQGCPSCGLGFHADCWQENHGCSAYGCSQVGAVGKHG